MATLDNVIGQLKDNKKSQDQTTAEVRKGNTLLSNYLEGMKTDRMKDLEAQRESMRKLAESLGKGGGIGGAATAAKGKGAGGMIPEWAKMGAGGLGGALAGSLLGRMLGALTRLIAPIIAGLTALELASEGLRGWELGAVKKLTDLTKDLPNKITTGVGALGTAIDDFIRSSLKGFGIDEFIKDQDGKKVQNRDGNKFAKGFQVKKTLEMFQEALVKAKNGIISNVFGVVADVDGNARIQMPEFDAEAVKTGDAIADALKAGDQAADMSKVGKAYSSIVTAFGKVITPVVSFGEAIGGIFTKFFATFASVAKFLGITDAILATGKIGAAIVGKFGGLVNKILLPIGLLFSGFKAVEDWMNNSENSDMSTSDKVASAISAFISDFVGAPLDLLKMGFTWIYKNLFGLETDANGKIIPGDGLGGKIGAAIEKFSFVEFIDNFVEGAWGFIKAAFDELTEFFGDPKGYVTDAYNKFLEKNEADSLGGVLTNWATGLFEWISGMLPSIDDIAKGLESIIEGLVPNWAREWFGLPPDPEVAQQIAEAKAARGITDTMTDAEKTARDRLFRADINEDGKITLAEIEKAMGSAQFFNTSNPVIGSFAATMQQAFPNLFGNAGMKMSDAQFANFNKLIEALSAQGAGLNFSDMSTNVSSPTALVVPSGGSVNNHDSGNP